MIINYYSIHRVLLSTLRISSKLYSDIVYDNKVWCNALGEILEVNIFCFNKMEYLLCIICQHTFFYTKEKTLSILKELK